MSSLIIFCYPHYGIIDNNYDLIKKIFSSHKVDEIVVACPSLSILLAALDNSSLQSQLIELNTSLLVCFFDSFWFKFSLSRFTSFQKKSLPLLNKFFLIESRIVWFLKRLKLTSLASLFKDLSLKWCVSRSSADIFISDITQHVKYHVREFFKSLRVESMISIPHGVSLPAQIDISPDCQYFNSSIQWSVYIHTPLWLTLFKDKYLLSSSDITVCGIPKHWPLGYPKTFYAPKKSSLTFVLCSRPYTTRHYLLKDQKYSYLKELKRIVLNSGHSLILKLHPGESDINMFTESLGSSSSTNKWSITDQSTSDIATVADICILFYSGTCVDFIVRGIPCIERSNLEQCPASSPSTFFKGSGNRLSSPYSHYGLVAHAYDEATLAELISTSIQEPHYLTTSQYRAYQTCFPRPQS